MTWVEVLDRLEAEAAELAAFAARPDVDLAVLDEPVVVDVDGPLPPHLAARAAVVQAALDAAAAALSSARDRVATELSTVGHHEAPVATARYIDTSF